MKQSKQRNIIYDVVMTSRDHPDAKMILERVNQIMPSINIATVYRNLTQLCEQKMIRRIPLEDGDRFDYDTTNHSHFYCLSCKCLSNIEVEGMTDYHEMIVDKYHCAITSIDNLIQGYCEKCLECKITGKVTIK